MKILLAIILIFPIFNIVAQNPVQPKDSTVGKDELIIISPEKKVHSDTSELMIIRDSSQKHKEANISELFIIGRNAYKRGHICKNDQYPPFEGHWSGFYYGFVNFGNTDYSMYEGTAYEEYGEFMELDWSHSFAMQFNVFKHSINLVHRNNFGIVWGAGFEYQRLRFENNYSSVTWADHQLIPIDLHENDKIASVKRSSFKTFYLTIPLMLELQLPAAKRNRFYISGGIMGGVRLHSKTKVVYKDGSGDKHKKKEKNNFNMVPFKADLVGRVGYKRLSLWGSYTLTNMFKSDKGPELHAYTVGIGVTF